MAFQRHAVRLATDKARTVMDKPKLVPCRAAWMRGLEVEYWNWYFDTEKKAYIRHGEEVTGLNLMLIAAEMQAEGWLLCRAVV